jgi:hypothetical protein
MRCLCAIPGGVEETRPRPGSPMLGCLSQDDDQSSYTQEDSYSNVDCPQRLLTPCLRRRLRVSRCWTAS